MLFVSVDEEVKRVAHTSGVIEMIGKKPVNLPVFDPETGLGYRGLKECAMAAGCVPYIEKAVEPAAPAPAPVAAPAPAPVVPEPVAAAAAPEPAAPAPVEAAAPAAAAKPPKATVIKE